MFQNFDGTLTNDVVSFEQPGLDVPQMNCIMSHLNLNCMCKGFSSLFCYVARIRSNKLAMMQIRVLLFEASLA